MNAPDRTAADAERDRLAARRVALAGALIMATDLSEADLDRLEAGIVAASGEAAARLQTQAAALAGGAPQQKRVGGLYKGLLHVGPEFFEPLPEDELRLWEGG